MFSYSLYPVSHSKDNCKTFLKFLGVGIDENRWINLAKLMFEVIFPMGDSILYFQEFNSALALSKTFSKFIFEMLFRSVEKIIP